VSYKIKKNKKKMKKKRHSRRAEGGAEHLEHHARSDDAKTSTETDVYIFHKFAFLVFVLFCVYPV
jgi:hypothetical protein